MAVMTREQFLEAQKNYAKRQEPGQETKVHVQPWFKINDGEEAIVRFAYKDVDDLKYMTVHKVDDGTSKYPRSVNCLRDYRDSIDTCPLCAAGNKPKQRMFIQLINYVTDENGQITAVPCIWEQSAQTWMTKLINWFGEYPNLSEQIFKIKRTGKELNTSYQEIPANPRVYNNDDYPCDLTPFDNYTPLGTFALVDASKEEMLEKYVPSLKVEEPVEEEEKRVVHTF